MKPDIEKLNKHKIVENLRKQNFSITCKLKVLPDDLQYLVLQCVTKKVRILRTKNICLRQFVDLFEEFNIQLQIIKG